MSTWDPGKEVRRGLIGRCTQNHHWGRQGEQLGWVEEWRSEASTGDSSRGLSHTSEVSTATLPLEMIYAWLFH